MSLNCSICGCICPATTPLCPETLRPVCLEHLKSNISAPVRKKYLICEFNACKDKIFESLVQLEEHEVGVHSTIKDSFDESIMMTTTTGDGEQSKILFKCSICGCNRSDYETVCPESLGNYCHSDGEIKNNFFSRCYHSTEDSQLTWISLALSYSS